MTQLANEYQVAWTVDDLSVLDGFIADCNNATSNESVFSIFRTLLYIRNVVENRSVEHIPILLDAVDSCSFPVDPLSIAAQNDQIGTPATVSIRGHDLSPTTITYIMYAGIIHELLGSLDGMRIAEIGGGYGGLAGVISGLWNVDYTIYDSPEPLALQSRFLQALGRKAPTLRSSIEPDSFDLVFSSCALSELSIQYMAAYMENVLKPSLRGVLIWNICNSVPWIRQPEWAFGWLSDNLHPTPVSWGRIHDTRSRLTRDIAQYVFWWTKEMK
jgi:hypothetical protein